MFTNTILPRVFNIDQQGNNVKLSDPNPDWTPDHVLNHYLALYPILATATISKPVIRDDQVVYEFLPAIGTKG